MSNRMKSVKIVACAAGIFALGVAASGGAGRIADHLSSTAHADIEDHCHLSDLQGKWSYSYQGEIAGVGKLTAVGVEQIDSNGHAVGTDTFALDGDAATVTFNGNFTMSPNCKGTVAFNFSDGTSANAAVVMMDGGNEVHFIATDPGTSLLGVAKRRF